MRTVPLIVDFQYKFVFSVHQNHFISFPIIFFFQKTFLLSFLLIFLVKKVPLNANFEYESLFSLKWYFWLNTCALNFLEQDLILLSILGNIDQSFFSLFVHFFFNMI